MGQNFVIACAAALFAGSAWAGAPFKDPMDVPALTSKRPAGKPLQAIARAGARLVAVGHRGLVLVSDDEGKQWRQVAVPVGSDLVAVQFVSPARGWASGHDGVVLQTQDAGSTWTRQLDGRQMAKVLTSHFEQALAAGNKSAVKQLEDLRLNFTAGPEQPILGLWFDDANHGWAVSTFGMILGTQDGGRTWASWMERVDNPESLHLYSITGVGGDVYITSERGHIFKLNRAEKRFQAIATGYEGGLFGVTGTPQLLVAYGLRGNAWRSRDGGRTWSRLRTGVQTGINAGAILPDKRLALVTQDGRVLVSVDEGESFTNHPAPHLTVLTGIAPANATGNELALTGFGGTQRLIAR